MVCLSQGKCSDCLIIRIPDPKSAFVSDRASPTSADLLWPKLEAERYRMTGIGFAEYIIMQRARNRWLAGGLNGLQWTTLDGENLQQR